MIVIDVKTPLVPIWHLAYGADMALSLKHGIVILSTEPEQRPQLVVESLLGVHLWLLSLTLGPGSVDVAPMAFWTLQPLDVRRPVPLDATPRTSHFSHRTV